MSYGLSFSHEFFLGDVPLVDMKPSIRPTSVAQALVSLTADEWAVLASEVFDCPPDVLDVETVLQKVRETDSCRNLDPPVEVYIDPEGWHSILVY